ncbi:MAG: hypothetical protein MJY97_01235 [Bacteroidales bacterium]|nr:hypothetical protein [Bacteroidales bacterium]
MLNLYGHDFVLAPIAATDKLMEFTGWLLDKYNADGRVPDTQDMISYTFWLTGA